MDTIKKFDELYTEVTKMADKMSRWSNDNKRKGFSIYIAISVLSSLITILVAMGNDINERYGVFIKSVILTFSGVATVLAAWDGFFNHKQLWVNYGETSALLRALQLKLRLLTDEEKKDNDLFRSLYVEFQNVLNNNNQRWIQLRAEERDKRK